MFRPSRTTDRRPRLGFESLEVRELLSAVPFGADPADTGEFMLGEVLVSLVLMESDGSIDASTEDWTAPEIEAVKATVREGLDWWSDVLALQSSRQTLDFQIDTTFADHPVATGYEPIARRSDDFVLWIEDFLAAVGHNSAASFSDDMRAFNHQQRLAFDANWAFTIFVVNAEADPDGRFATNGSFTRSFAYAGGRFFVMPHNRPASTVAHETGHMFWAFDEYAGGEPYSSTRGYYNTQNLNGYSGNPNPAQRSISIMDSPAAAFPLHAVSPSALEMIGWRDSDGDGIFDLLDVPHLLVGSGQFDSSAGAFHFVGDATVQTLPNQNPSGLGHDITLNRIRQIEYRVNEGAWQTAARVDDYSVTIDVTVNGLPKTGGSLEIRALDDRTGVASNVLAFTLPATPAGGWQNPRLAVDVDNDQQVAPIDALLLINDLNRAGSRPLPDPPQDGEAPPYLDVNGDGFLSPLDALLVINYLNNPPPAAAAVAEKRGPTPYRLDGNTTVLGEGSAPFFQQPPAAVAAPSRLLQVARDDIFAAFDDAELEAEEPGRVHAVAIATRPQCWLGGLGLKVPG